VQQSSERDSARILSGKREIRKEKMEIDLKMEDE
jgi:hypothetical protein